MFLHLSVSHSVHGGIEYLGRYPPRAGTPPWAGTRSGRYPPWAVPPGQVHPPRQVHTPLGRYPRAGTPLPHFPLPPNILKMFDTVQCKGIVEIKVQEKVHA